MEPQLLHDFFLQLLGRLHAVRRDDKGLDALHPARILYADNTAVGDLGTAVDDVFQLRGIDIVAVGDDHALKSLPEVYIAVLVHHAEVAGIQPGVAVGQHPQRLCRLLRQLEIAGHDRRTFENNFTLLTGEKLLVRARLHNAVNRIGEGNADAALAVVVLGRETAGGDTFGQSVSFTHLNVRVVRLEKGVDLLFQLHRKAVAAAEHAKKEAHVQPVKLRHVEQGFKDGRHACDEIRLLAAQHIGVALVVEGRHENAARAVNQNRMYVDAQPEAMEHRHTAQHFVALAEFLADRLSRLHGTGVEVQVSQADALGRAAGAAAVENDSRALRVKCDLGQYDALVVAVFQEYRPQHVRLFGEFQVILALFDQVKGL